MSNKNERNIKMTEQVKETNYEIFVKTVNNLKNSQGFYSRLAARLAELTDDEKERVKDELNALPQWNDVVDCVLYLEQ